jgi:integrase
MASVNTKGTDIWHASIRVWEADTDNPGRGRWRRTWRTTGIPSAEPRAVAQKVADALQEAALAVAPANPRRADQRVFVEMLEGIWRAAGVTPPQVSSSWREFSAGYLKEGNRSERTQASYRSQIGIFTEWLGRKADDLLWNLGHDDFQKFHGHLLAGGRAEKTARNHIVMLQSIMEKAFLQGIIPRNPAKLVAAPGGQGVKRLPFEPVEFQAILRLLDHPPADFPPLQPPRHTEWKTATLLGLCCGLRLGDATGRRWRDFDLTAGTVALVPEKKAKKGRVITLPLAPPLLAHLRTLAPSGEWLTPTLRESWHNTEHFVQIVERAGVIMETSRRPGAKGAGRDLRLKTFHSLRHTLNTLLAKAGTEKQLRMLISDHDDPRVNDRYTHGTVERLGIELAKVFPDVSGPA